MNNNQLFVEVKSYWGGGSWCRPATKSEIDRARRIRADLNHIREEIKTLTEREKALSKGCNHNVIFDSVDWPTDERVCFACGRGRGRI